MDAFSGHQQCSYNFWCWHQQKIYSWHSKTRKKEMTNIRSGSRNTCKIPSEDTQTIEQTFEGAWNSTEPDGGSTNNVYIETVPVNYIYPQASITWATEVGIFFSQDNNVCQFKNAFCASIHSL